MSWSTTAMTPEKGAAIVTAWNARLYIEWYDYERVGYSLYPNILTVGHCKENQSKITGRQYNVRSVSVSDDGLVIETDRMVFIFKWNQPKPEEVDG